MLRPIFGLNFLTRQHIKFSSVAICGLSTPLGKALSDVLYKFGVSVIEITETDLKMPARSLSEKLDTTDGIINLYGEPFVAKWSGRYEFDIYKSRLEALRVIGTALKYCKTDRIRFLITLSNAMVYDQYEVHDEYSNVYGDSFMSEVGQMETFEAMKIARLGLDIRLIIARAGYIMSPNGGAYPLLATLSRIGMGGCVDDGYQCLPVIHVDDAALALLTIASNDTAEGIFNLTIPQMASMNELVEAFEKTTSRNQHRLPKFIIKLLAGRAINLLEQNCKVNPVRLLKLGFEFKYKTIDDIISNLQIKKK